MIAMYERVVVTEAVPGTDLQAGDVGIVVAVYNLGEAYDVEFLNMIGDSVGTETVFADEVLPVAGKSNGQKSRREETVSDEFSHWLN